MMYAVKLGNYYVKAFDSGIYNIILSRQVMGSFTKTKAREIAKLIKGEVVEIAEVPND